jgi:putative ABC transport system substrate-binding protein
MNRPRRALVVALALSMLTVPIAAQPQHSAIPRIGVLFASTPAATPQNVEALRQGLGALGHVEGRTFAMEIRYAEARAERLPELARELLGLKVDVILASTDGAVAAVKQRTQAIRSS